MRSAWATRTAARVAGPRPRGQNFPEEHDPEDEVTDTAHDAVEPKEHDDTANRGPGAQGAVKRSLVVCIAVIAFGATPRFPDGRPSLGLDLAGAESCTSPAHHLEARRIDVIAIVSRVPGCRGPRSTPVGRAIPGGRDPRGLVEELISTTAQVLLRPVLCGASPTARSKGKAPPSGALRHAGRPDSNAAQVRAEQHPGRPPVRRLPVDPLSQDDATKTCPGDPAAGTQRFERFVLGPSRAQGRRHRHGAGGAEHERAQVGGDLHPDMAGSPAWDQVAQRTSTSTWPSTSTVRSSRRPYPARARSQGSPPSRAKGRSAATSPRPRPRPGPQLDYRSP